MFREIFEYHFELNNQIIELLKKEMNSLPERTFPLFCHILNAHQIWNARILNQKSFGVHQIHEINNCKSNQFDKRYTISYYKPFNSS